MSSNSNKNSNNSTRTNGQQQQTSASEMAASAAATSSGKKRKVWARTVNISSNNSNSAAATDTPAVKITSNSGRTVNITNSSGRTVNITATNNNKNNQQNDGLTPEQLEAATMGMNSEDTAKYIELHKAHVKRMSSSERSSAGRSGGQGGGGTEVKISFGPSRPPSSSSSNNSSSNNKKNNSSSSSSSNTSAAVTAAQMAAMMGASSGGSGSSSISFGDLDLEALKEKAAAAAAGQNTFRNKHGLPCTEAEMKALMSMFVEIMGMSMNNNNNNNNGGKNNSGVSGGVATFNGANNSSDSKKSANNSNSSSSSSNKNGGPVFSFGSNPMDASSLAAVAAAASGSSSGMIPDHMAAATAGFFADGASWEALRRTYAAAEQMAAAEDDDDDDDDDESFENRELTFEEVEFLLHHRKQKEEAAKLASQFASGDWESLEQVAINDHLLESDDRERKAVKKREKKQRRKAKLKEEAAQKAAEAAQKKREKAIVSWRSRVVSACQSNEITKLDGLLQETPLRKLMEEDNNDDEASKISTSSIISHLEFLLPNSVAKNRAHVERGIEARLRLAEYVLHTDLLLAFKPLRSGRTALHTACFHGDVRFLQLLFDKVDSYEPKEGNDPLPESFLNLTCDESGWSPLHYAAVSGSSEVMELLLEKGSNLSTLTDVTHTWKESDGRGITPGELVQYVQSGDYEKDIETHGLALQEMTNSFFNHHQERRVFLRKLERVYQRLSDVEKNGYTPISKGSTNSIIESEITNEDESLNPSEISSSKNKKKKKKKKKQSGKEAESRTEASNTADQKHAASAHSDSTEVKEKEDPLVTALLGMGFIESQILAAVKACGGTHRATADDLVMWILGQGGDEESAPEASSADIEEQSQESDNNDRHQREDSPGPDEIAQREEAARQQEETTRRLAAKREEKRRRNREWNNREQARQEQEAIAKVTQKAFSAPQSSVPVPFLGVPLQSNAPRRMPNGMHPTASLPAHSISGIKSSTRQPHMVLTTPEMISGGQWANAPVTMQSQSFASSSQPNNFTSAPTLATSHQPVLHASSYFSSINDDDKTVSSFGSNRGMSISSKEFVPLVPHGSVPPPGFVSGQPMTVPLRPPVATVPEDSSSVVYSEDNQQGEIRATAKAFVPSNFGQNTMPKSASLQNEYIPSHGRGAPQTVFPPGMLQQHETPSGHSSLLGSGLPSSFDHTPSMTPASEDSAAPSTSFVNGPNAEEPPLSVPFGFSRGKSEESNDIGGSRLLSTMSKNSSVGSASIWGGNQNIPSLESTLQPSFFGDGNSNDVDNEKNNTWSIPGGNLPSGGGQGSIW
jgi:ankyrin repeat protein